MSSIAIRRAAPASSLASGGTTAAIFALASSSQAACTLPVPGKLVLEGKRFTVRAEGSLLIAAGTTTAGFTLLGAVAAIPASPLVPGSWTTIAAPAAQSGSGSCSSTCRLA